MGRESWFLVRLAGRTVAVARLDGRWSVVARGREASADSLGDALLETQRS
jgi:hypothetical protein